VAALRAGDAGEAVARLVALAGSAEAVAATVRLVVNQRLVRLLCPQCKEPYRPNPDFIRKANLGSQRVEVLFRPPTRVAAVDGKAVECPQCRGTRYVARTGLFELMLIDEEARKIIAGRASASDLRVYARKRSMRNLQEEGLQLVIDGRTSIDEVLRAIKQTR
jgi:type II secretory ATPase GspE/PulE/Tfp pilus assembly ATPase PilB-like protein